MISHSPKAEDIDDDSWERFEHTVNRMLRTPPQPRKKGDEEKAPRQPEQRDTS